MSDETNSPRSYEAAIVTDSSGSEGNPAWNDVLGAIPEEYHQALTPHLQNWDKGVNDRFTKIHEEYKPYKAFKEQGLDADQINFALGVIQKLEADPLSIYRPLHEHLAANGLLDLGQEDEDDDDYAETSEGNFHDPRVDQLQNQWQTLTEAFLAQEQAKAEAAEDAILDAELAEMKDKYGEYDEEFVLERMAATGMETEEAVQSYFQLVDEILTKRNRPTPPRILGSAGAFPGKGQIDPKKLNDRMRRDLVADMLRGDNH